ncbi:aminoalkylphosphonate N-acetyltransferase [Nemorincola caseinilytica]|uniref:Aminoalkylphosphonate N-acetyltransferase n=1 Tax=Nemorincola caseinilytica TaxID=2054315 RepID=A0ABP8NAW3_9BACT
MPDIHIASATAANLDAIYGFVCALEEQVFDKELLRGYYEHCLSLPHHHYLVAFVQGVAVGYISCHGQVLLHHCGIVYEIQELYVQEQHRGMGIGARLVRAVEDILAAKGYASLEVCSGTRRTDAHRFYQRMGFRHTSFKFVKEP